MKRIRSYSFIELMVVMVIGTITIAIAYQGYILFYKQFLQFKNTAEKNSSIVFLDAALVNDFNSSKEVKRTSDGVVCAYYDKEVTYTWSDNYVVRKQSLSIDTFYVQVKGLQVSLDSKESLEGGLVDGIYFLGKGGLHFQIGKRYGADVLINAELKNK